MPNRPADLPEFRSPPLNEVVVGVQFATPRGYSQIHAGRVWELFRERFPLVEEHPPLPPMFETFGLPQMQQFSFGLEAAAQHSRYWFIAPERDHLIQFQSDRLLHNWRKSSAETSKYPRFESIIKHFEEELADLNRVMQEFDGNELHITQCELTYINHIPLDGSGGMSPDDWFTFIDPSAFGADDMMGFFRRAIRGEDGSARGRLVLEFGTALGPSLSTILAANLTTRGAPRSPSIADGLAFIREGRELIVKTFAQITSPRAQAVWERTQ